MVSFKHSVSGRSSAADQPTNTAARRLRIHASVLRLVAGVVLVLLLQGRRGDVEAAAPDLDLIRAMLLHLSGLEASLGKTSHDIMA